MTTLMKQGSTDPTVAAALAPARHLCCGMCCIRQSLLVPLTCPLPTGCCMLSQTGMSLGHPLAAGSHVRQVCFIQTDVFVKTCAAAGRETEGMGAAFCGAAAAAGVKPQRHKLAAEHAAALRAGEPRQGLPSQQRPCMRWRPGGSCLHHAVPSVAHPHQGGLRRSRIRRC